MKIIDLLNEIKDEHPEKVPSKKALVAWLKKNPNPEDEDLHKWVEQNGWNIHEVEDMMYKIATSHIKEKRGLQK